MSPYQNIFTSSFKFAPQKSSLLMRRPDINVAAIPIVALTSILLFGASLPACVLRGVRPGVVGRGEKGHIDLLSKTFAKVSS